MVDKKKTKPKSTKPKVYHATILLNVTKAPFQVSGTFVKASDQYVTVIGDVGDDIGKKILVPHHVVKAIYLTESS